MPGGIPQGWGLCGAETVLFLQAGGEQKCFLASKQIPQLCLGLGCSFFFFLLSKLCSWPQVPGAEFKATAVQSRGDFQNTGWLLGADSHV